MKKIIVMTCLGYITAFTSIAQDNGSAASKPKSAVAIKRANHLSDQMIRELRLNNFQAAKIREINLEKVNKMMAVEANYANNPTYVDQVCKGICKESDREVESILSASQYSKYFAARPDYYKTDTEFAVQIGLRPSNKTVKANKSVDLPVGDRVVTSEQKTTPVLRPSDSK